MRLSRRSALRVVFLLVVLVLLSLQISFGQSDLTLRGTITDPTGAAVVGAMITAHPVGGMNLAAFATSAAGGAFSLALTPGRYRVTISAQSFLPITEDLTLESGAPRVLDEHLQLAVLSSSVVVSAEAEPQRAVDVIAPSDVLTQTDIDREQQIWLTPLLATVPGVVFSQLGPEGGTTSLFLDGGNSNYTRVMIDGVPADVSLPGISIDLSDYTTESIDKIEVVHGASSALYGSDAMTGVVDILTHRGSTTGPALVLQGQGGSFGTGIGSGQLSGLLGRFDYSVGAGYFTTRGQAPSAAAIADNPGYDYPYLRNTTLTGNFGWKFSDANTLRLTLRNGASDAGQPGQTLFPSVPFAVTPGAHSVLHDFASGLAWDFQPGEHWQTHIQGFESRHQDFFDEPSFDFSSVDKFNRAGLDARTTYWFGRGEVTAGYYFENETGGVLGRHDNAGYSEARFQVTKRLTIVAGGRVEANDSFGTRFVPRAGVTYAARNASGFWGDTRLLMSYGHGTKEPPLFPDNCDPVLKPEQSTTFDAGINQYLDSGRLRLSVTFFHNDFRNVVSFASGAMPNGLPQNCAAFFGSYFNTDKARAFGTDSAVTVKAAGWLDFGGTYSYDDSRVLDSPYATDPALLPGNRLLKRPLNSANLFLNAHFRGINWNVTGYFVGRRTDSDFLGLEMTRNPGYVRWDTSAIVPLRYGVSFTAHMQNLFDKHYQDALGYPALGYNYRLGIRYVWGGAR